jgi:hypothetical protein
MGISSTRTQLLDNGAHNQLGAGNRLRSEKLWLRAEARVGAPEVA